MADVAEETDSGGACPENASVLPGDDLAQSKNGRVHTSVSKISSIDYSPPHSSVRQDSGEGSTNHSNAFKAPVYLVNKVLKCQEPTRCAIFQELGVECQRY